ncbi:hypothetical protein EDB86DRAFT_3077790 [Lactarius hatsudake]|nr:hypothetical protein EDB86DRAFT_3077790 [Lactarius hatsudake]
MPLPSLQPSKQQTFSFLFPFCFDTARTSPVLSRVSGILAGRGFNIDSLVTAWSSKQARQQLEDLVPVWAVLDYTETRMISRELLLVKVSILGPEYLEDQLEGGL